MHSLSIEELGRRMRPGALSEQGFLGRHESLEAVLAADAQALEQLSLLGDDLARPGPDPGGRSGTGPMR
jgi:hypothetical protein